MRNKNTIGSYCQETPHDWIIHLNTTIKVICVKYHLTKCNIKNGKLELFTTPRDVQCALLIKFIILYVYIEIIVPV